MNLVSKKLIQETTVYFHKYFDSLKLEYIKLAKKLEGMEQDFKNNNGNYILMMDELHKEQNSVVGDFLFTNDFEKIYNLKSMIDTAIHLGIEEHIESWREEYVSTQIKKMDKSISEKLEDFVNIININVCYVASKGVVFQAIVENKKGEFFEMDTSCNYYGGYNIQKGHYRYKVKISKEPVVVTI